MNCAAIVNAFLLTLVLSGGLTGGSEHAFAGGSTVSAGSSEAETRPVAVARATAIPACTSFVDAASSVKGGGTAEQPHNTIAAAVEAAQSGAVICVAEGTYAEDIAPGEKYFTLAGGFQSGHGFKVRDSAKFVSHAKGKGSGSFLRIQDPGPATGLTAVDGFEISGYSQAIVRDFYVPQRFDLTNNYIHDNKCSDPNAFGGAFALNNISGSIRGNVIRNNACNWAGGGFLNDATKNSVSVESNLVDSNSGTAEGAAHGGGMFLGGYSVSIVGNAFVNNVVTMWGGGLIIAAYTAGNQPTTATLAWNLYRGNRAGDSGGGFFCDEGATCIASHEIYDSNCGGNVLLDGGAGGSGPTRATFDHVTNVGALDVGCGAPGIGVFVDTYQGVAADSYSFTNSLFWGNAPGKDFATACGSGCDAIKVNVASSLLQKNYTQDGGIKISFGQGIIDSVDPQFVAPSDGDFHLRTGSPAIGKGDGGSDLGALGSGGQPQAIVEEAEQAQPAAEVPPQQSAATEVETPAPAQPESEAPAAAAAAVPASPDAPQAAPPTPRGETADVSAKEAFEAAKDLGTAQGWNAFLASYPQGFYADLARAYLEKLGGSAGVPVAPEPAAPQAAAPEAAAPDAPATLTPTPAATPEDVPAPQTESAAPPPPDNSAALEATTPAKPAVARGAEYMGFPEKFNRYYTDPAWKPLNIIYVSPDGSGDGATRETPMAVKTAVRAAKPGTEIYFLRGKYQGCFEFTKENSGTYDEPIVLYGERNADKSIGVSMTCCTSGRQTCFNMEAADYVAVEGFELVGGKYGVRAVGAGYPASQHSSGIAMLHCNGHDQSRDPFFTGQSDWAVFERNVASGAKKEDGHGIYLSNGGDWNIVRFNQTFGNASSDFQINADPASTCAEAGIPFADPRCDAYAGEGDGGQGASDYFLLDGNYFHSSDVGPNFTSVRRSVVRNNIFGPQVRHNASFWQETDNPKLGTSGNKILNNLFITANNRQAVQFKTNSTGNEFANNVILGIKIEGGTVTANTDALLMEVDETVAENVYRDNLYISGKMEGREPADNEIASEDFSPSWFRKFPTGAARNDPNGFTPTAEAPFLGKGSLHPDAAADRNGTPRADQVDLGPIEVE